MLDDARYALRLFAASPGFTAVALGTLALAIGANTVIFSAVDAVLLTPLAYRDSNRIVEIVETAKSAGGAEMLSSVPKFDLLRAESRTLEPVAALSYSGFQLTSDRADPAQVAGAHVSADFFRLFSASPSIGRVFTDEENRRGGANVAIISDALWHNRFAGDPHIAGRRIGLNGAAATIVGVMPAAFDFPDGVEIWTPRVFESTVITPVQAESGASFLLLLGRLKPGGDAHRAQAEIAALSARYDAAHPDFADAGRDIRIRTLRDSMVSGVRVILLALSGAVAFVLLIGSANLANLLLARAVARRREIAIRVSLGATPARLLVQLLTESVLLSLGGAAVGMLLAEWSVPLVARLNSAILPRAGEIHIDARVLAFTVAIAAGAGVLFGLAPAFDALRVDLNRALKETARTASGGGARLRAMLVIVEVALAMILLSGAGLLARSFSNIERADPGFRPEHLLSATIPLAPARYPQAFAQAAFFDRVRDGAAALPGVDRAAITSCPPVHGGYCIGYFYSVAGRPEPEPSKAPTALLRSVSPDYFETMRIPLLEGRAFTPADSADSPRVAIINETMAHRQWPSENPLGKRFVYSREHVSVEIVGVAANVKFNALGDTNVYDEIYVPMRQRPFLTMSLIVRGARDPAQLASAIRGEVSRIDAAQPLTKVETMEAAMSETVARPRLETVLMGTLAFLALLLAAIGIFGVVAWSVSQRTREIGIRMALGARPGDVLAMITGQAFRAIGAGEIVGLAGALALTRGLSSVLFGVSPTDPLTFAGGAVLLAAVSLLACWMAVRRATRIDPVAALREE